MRMNQTCCAIWGDHLLEDIVDRTGWGVVDTLVGAGVVIFEEGDNHAENNGDR